MASALQILSYINKGANVLQAAMNIAKTVQKKNLKEMSTKEAADKDPESGVEALFKEVISKFDGIACAMSGEPVVEVMIPTFEAPANHIFERKAMNKWLKEKPNQAPPGWLENEAPLPLKREYFMYSAAVQHNVNKVWEAIFHEFFTQLSEKTK